MFGDFEEKVEVVERVFGLKIDGIGRKVDFL